MVLQRKLGRYNKNYISIMKRSIHYTLCWILLLPTYSTANCINNGTKLGFNEVKYPIIICENIKYENLDQEVQDIISNPVILIIKTINCRDFNDLYYFPYKMVEHLKVYDNKLELNEDGFNKFHHLFSLEIHRSPVSKTTFQGFILNQDANYYFAYLKMSRNGIKNIDSICLRHSILKILHLTENDITDIDSSNFIKCANLVELNLSHNKIELIEPDAFRDLQILKRLNLANNKLKSINPNLFTELRALTDLNLSNNNIMHIQCETKENKMNDVKHLDLSHNAIRTIDVCEFKQFLELASLDLRHNNLSYIASGSFLPLYKLEQLYLSHNQLKDFDAKLIYPLKSLRELHINDNMLDNWNIKPVVSNMKYFVHVDMSNNKWTCGNLADMIKFLSSRNIDAKPRKKVVYEEENVNGIKCTDERKESEPDEYKNETKFSYTLNEVKQNDDDKINITTDLLKHLKNSLEKNIQVYSIYNLGLYIILAFILLFFSVQIIIKLHTKFRKRHITKNIIFTHNRNTNAIESMTITHL